MAIQLSVTARNNRLDAIEAEMITGGAPVLKLRTGSAPAFCVTADSGTVLCSMSLPADPMAAANAGAKAKGASAWTGTASGGGGVVAHFRIYKNDGTTCVVQGTCGIGTGDLQLDNTTVADGQTVTVTGFTLTDGNA